MKRFVEGEDRRQGALLPHCLDDLARRQSRPNQEKEAAIGQPLRYAAGSGSFDSLFALLNDRRPWWRR
jgi:hypothetical protein